MTQHYGSSASIESPTSTPPLSGRESRKSSVVGASTNFANCIVGAGCIGFGGAIADAGGIVSIIAMLLCAGLSKLSFDLLIKLGLQTGDIDPSYESLGHVAFGRRGMLAVLISKGIFSFMAQVSIIIILRDNFGPALRSLLSFWMTSGGWDSWKGGATVDDRVSTLLVSVVFMLPLCMLRDLTPLEHFSAFKVFALFIILVIVASFYFTENVPPLEGSTTYTQWFQVRPGVLRSMGTFIFAFIAQHTVHLVYNSLKHEHRNVADWSKVSSFAILISVVLSLPIGLFPYLTYWEQTSSNLFLLYPSCPRTEMARLLLSVTMVLSLPPPFLSCRELIVTAMHRMLSQQPKDAEVGIPNRMVLEQTTTLLTPHERNWSLPGEDGQLSAPYHVLLTVALWSVLLALALLAPSLGDVLNLTGCATGTLIAFILPGAFAVRLEGYTHTAGALLAVGTLVGTIGTWFSLIELLSDI